MVSPTNKNYSARTVERDDVTLTHPNNQLITDKAEQFLDRDWAASAFLMSDGQLGDPVDVQNRYWSSANAKFTDGRLGCNIGINPKPQFTRYSDIRSTGRKNGRNAVSTTNALGNHGMGRYYSEAIDDPSQTIYMRFGVPQFNSISNFIANAFDANQTSLARTGNAKGVFYSAAKLAGGITTVLAFPAVAALIFAGRLVAWVFSRPTSKFYTMKPTMHLYWSTVNTLVNNIAVNKGLLPKILAPDVNEAQRLGQPFKLDQEYLNQLSELMPDIFRDNYFDIMALANKAQRVANKVFLEDYEKLNNGTASDYLGILKKDMTGTGKHTTYISDSSGGPTLAAMLNKVAMLGYYLASDSAEAPAAEVDPRISGNSVTEEGKDKGKNVKKDPSFFESMIEHFDSEFRDGSQFATFKVDHTGSMQEAFGNSVTESGLSQKLNGISSSIREARFTFAEGNVVGGAVGAVAGSVMSTIKDTIEGAASGLTLGFSDILAGLGGSGYIDIPKHWQSSTATLPRTTYNIKLISPYGNMISQMQNLYIPLSMLLAGTLPLSTGKQSYTAPFLCQLYDRGRCQIKLGMIESLSITRGTSNLSFNTKGQPLAIDVSFNVVDLSSIMHMPVSSGELFKIDIAIDEDNILSDYLAVLAGQDLYTQMYAIPKAKLRVAKAIMSTKKLTSPAYWASLTHESMTSGMINTLTLGASGVLSGTIEGLSRGNAGAAGPLQ